MTLEEWCRKAGTHHTHPTTEWGAVSVIFHADEDHGLAWELWHLDDYFVSSRTGVVVWLLPRRDVHIEHATAHSVSAGPEREPAEGCVWEHWRDYGGEG